MFNRLIPIATALVIFACLEFLFYQPRLIYFVALFLIIFLIAATWKIIGKGLATVRARWLYLLTPLSFLLGGILFILFLEQPWAKHLLAAAIAAPIAIFLENIFTYIWDHEKYQINSLENISNYLNLTSIFFLSSSFFGFFIFLNIPLWQLSLISLLVFFLLTLQTIWVNKIAPETAWTHIFVICLILFELFWTVSFLPTAFYVNGLMLAAAFYLMNNLMRLHLLNALNKIVIKRYLLLFGTIIVFILATARWR